MTASRQPAKRAPVQRVTVTTETPTVPSIIVPKGRTAAERRISALAALHQPIARVYRADRVSQILDGMASQEVVYVCGECKVGNDMGRLVPARWPCTTARLLGTWPGEPA